eukprot:365981-Chlamydomonas_euryale.AAC.23
MESNGGRNLAGGPKLVRVDINTLSPATVAPKTRHVHPCHICDGAHVCHAQRHTQRPPHARRCMPCAAAHAAPALCEKVHAMRSGTRSACPMRESACHAQRHTQRPPHARRCMPCAAAHAAPAPHARRCMPCGAAHAAPAPCEKVHAMRSKACML